MKLSIIIVNYNVRYFLEQCLYSVLPAVASIESEILVVDNDSTDGSLEYLQPLFPHVTFISNKKNLGFGKANNLALERAAGEYVLFLNPDTLVPEDCFTKCLSFFDEHPKAGAIGIRMLDGSGRFLPESKRSFPATSTAFYKLTGLSALFPGSRVFNKYSLGYLDDKENHPVDVLAGAFMMIRKQLLDTTGGFDEQFFMYGEDIDLSYRLKQAGYENWYFANACIIHFKGESSKKSTLKYVQMFYSAMIIFVQKHYKGKGASVLKFFMVTGIKAKAVLQFTKTFLKRRTSSLQKKEWKILIAGSKNEYDECYNIYHHAALEKHISGRFDSRLNDTADLLQLKDHCNKNNINTIVFCRGSLQYSSIISAVEILGPGYSYRFHTAGSRSIVGSDSKTDTGETLPGDK